MKGNEAYRELTKDVIAAQKGDPAAQERVIGAVRDTVYYTCYSALGSEDRAMDATQEITLKIFRRIGDLKNPATYVGWVNTITANYLRTLLGRKNVEFPVGPDGDGGDPFEAFEQTDEQAVPELVLEKNETMRVVREAIETLPDEQRLCVVLYYFDQMKTREIAAALHVSEGTVKSRLNYARKAMKNTLAPYEKRSSFRVLCILPLFGKLLGALKIVTAAGASAVTGLSFMRGIGPRVTAGAVAALLLGTAGIAATARSAQAPERTAETTVVAVQSEDVCCEVMIEEIGQPPRAVAEEQITVESVAYEPECPAPVEPVPTQPAQEPISGEAPVPEADRTPQPSAPEAQRTPQPSAPEAQRTPDDTAPESTPTGERVYEAEPDPVSEEPAEKTEEPAEKSLPTPLPEDTENTPRWSEWSTEEPPEGVEVRTKLQYRWRVIRLTHEHGAGQEMSDERAWSDWSDKLPDSDMIDMPGFTMEKRVMYSYFG